MRTTLEQYLAMSIQMLIAREDKRDEDPYLDKLDILWDALTDDQKAFCIEMGKDWERFH